jgi:hypothetical protein
MYCSFCHLFIDPFVQRWSRDQSLVKVDEYAYLFNPATHSKQP